MQPFHSRYTWHFHSNEIFFSNDHSVILHPIGCHVHSLPLLPVVSMVTTAFALQYWGCVLSLCYVVMRLLLLQHISSRGQDGLGNVEGPGFASSVVPSGNCWGRSSSAGELHPARSEPFPAQKLLQRQASFCDGIGFGSCQLRGGWLGGRWLGGRQVLCPTCGCQRKNQPLPHYIHKIVIEGEGVRMGRACLSLLCH